MRDDHEPPRRHFMGDAHVRLARKGVIRPAEQHDTEGLGMGVKVPEEFPSLVLQLALEGLLFLACVKKRPLRLRLRYPDRRGHFDEGPLRVFIAFVHFQNGRQYHRGARLYFTAERDRKVIRLTLDKHAGPAVGGDVGDRDLHHLGQENVIEVFL